jgi:Helix-turn-helix family
MSEPSTARRVAALVAPIHNVAYYTPEIRVFETLGVRGWWTAYFAYRSAPMGRVSPAVLAATFYGFSSRMIDRAVPAVWEHLTPQQAIDVRLDAVDRAWRRIFSGTDASMTAAVAAAAALLGRSIVDVDGGARPLYAGHTTLPWPGPPHLQLWHAATLLREHRGDSHTVALAAADVDPVECQVLMVARGHGNRATLQKIRGWNDGEWDHGVRELQQRGWLDAAGALTPRGRLGRDAIEDHTDALAAEPAARLGVDGVRRASELVAPIHERLFTAGSIPRSWPPPHLVERGPRAE